MLFTYAIRLLAIFAACSGVMSQPHRQHCTHLTGKLLSGEEQLHPGAKRFILNIGSHADPPIPFDNDTIVVAVEPNPDTAAKIPVIPNRYVLTAAVSDGWGLAAFNHYDDSSSFLVAQPIIAGKGRKGARILVPTLPLSSILHVLRDLECWFLKIDAQGIDFTVLKSGHNAVQKCRYIMAEMNCGGFSLYQGAQNDYEKHWLPYMTELGFKPVKPCNCTCETNIMWENTRIQVEPLADMQRKCPNCFTR